MNPEYGRFRERVRNLFHKGKMRIHFTRDSVCMGDDCNDNSRDFWFSEDATWEDILPVIKENRFLASVWGNDVVWVLENSRKEEILSYFTINDAVIRCTAKNTLREICGGVYELHFRYYSSRKKRGEHIEKVNGHDQYTIWKDGWLEEYKICIDDSL